MELHCVIITSYRNALCNGNQLQNCTQQPVTEVHFAIVTG